MPPITSFEALRRLGLLYALFGRQYHARFLFHCASLDVFLSSGHQGSILSI